MSKDKGILAYLYFDDVLLKTVRVPEPWPEYDLRVMRHGAVWEDPPEDTTDAVPKKPQLVSMVFELETYQGAFIIYRFAGVRV